MSDKYKKFRHFKDKKEEEYIKLIEEAPEICPILGAIKCDNYWFEKGIVYVSQPAYYTFTIPEWDEEYQIFNYVSIDMEEDFIRENIFIDLEDLLEAGWTIEELEKLYDIKIKEEI